MVTSFMDGDEVGTIQLNDFVFGTNPRWVNALWKLSSDSILNWIQSI